MGARYTCWGPDHEDLTAKVERDLDAHPPGGVVVFKRNLLDRLSRRAPDSGERKVLVVCSQGHENVFVIE